MNTRKSTNKSKHPPPDQQTGLLTYRYDVKHAPAENPPKIKDGDHAEYAISRATNVSTTANASTNTATDVKEEAANASTSATGTSANSSSTERESNTASEGLSLVQQQFVLRFCRQLASVIEACELSESAEIEVGRRCIDTSQITVKLQAEREYSHPIKT